MKYQAKLTFETLQLLYDLIDAELSYLDRLNMELEEKTKIAQLDKAREELNQATEI